MKTSSLLVMRVGLATSSILLFVAGLEPDRDRAVADPWTTAPQALTISAPPSLPDVGRVIRRDPFGGAPGPDGQADPPTGTTLGSVPNAGPLTIRPQNGPPIPVFGPGATEVPDAGTVVPAAGGNGSVSVIATMSGDGKHPLALIANGSRTDIVGIGDVLGSHRISRIVPQGIEFEDGLRISVSAPRTETTPSPATVLPNRPGGLTRPNYPESLPTPNPGTSGEPAGTVPAATAPPGPQTPIYQFNQTTSPYQFGPQPSPSPGATNAPIYRPYPGVQ